MCPFICDIYNIYFSILKLIEYDDIQK